MIYDHKTFQQNPEYISREIAGEYILIPTGSAAVTFNGLASLNETSQFLWLLLKEKHTFEEICDAFAKEYELTEEQSRMDVTDFIELCLSRNLLLLY